MKPYRMLTDDEWLAVAPLLPELQPRKETRGRPLTNTREVLNGVLWVMQSGSSWSMLPRRFPSYQTCHRRFKAWQRTGVLKWPYVEGLRMDEAMHPLTLLVVGLYGKVLPNQDGAPLPDAHAP